MAISNLLTPNPKIPNIINSYAPKPQGLVQTPTTVQQPQQQKPVVAKPVAPVVSTQKKPVATSPGSYKGVQITPGTDAQVQQQVKKIDTPMTSPSIEQNAPSIVNPNLALTTAPQTQQQTPTRGLFANVVTSLANRANQVNPMTQESYQRAQNLAENLRQSRQNQITASGEQALAPIPKGVAFGRQANVEQQYQAQQAALASQLAAEQSLAGLGQSQQGLEQSALASAAGLASPRSADVFVDPLTGQPIGDTGNVGSQLAKWASIRAGAQTAGQFTGDYQTGLATLRAADSIGNQIINTLQANPELNSQPIAGINNLKQLISGQISSGPQQLLSQQIAQYIQTLGLDPNTVMNIASQQQGTLGQLLDSLREMAGAQIEAKNPQNIISNPQGTNQPTTGGGQSQIVNTAVGPIDNSWF